jgi:hypothetical protein
MAGVSAVAEKNAQGVFTRLNGEGFAHGSTAGQPDLPVLRRDVEIPFGAAASLEVVRASFREVRLADLGLPATVLPLQPAQPKCNELPPFAAPSETVYGMDAPFPAVPAAISAEYVVRGHRVLTIDIAPAVYNPVRGTLRLYSHLEIRIKLDGADLALTESQARRYTSPAFENRLSQQLLNYNQGKLSPQFVSDTPVGYLIISPNNYLGTMAPFVSLKQSQGFTVTMASLSQIGSTKEQIKAYIQNAYDTWLLPPSYVLLVGDVNNGTESMPTWMGAVTGTSTDLNYVTVDGADYVPDIYRGRFPARSLTQLGSMVSRAVAYDALNGAEVWVKKAALLASDDMYELAEDTQNYVINTYTLPRNYTGTFPNVPQPGGDKLYALTYHANTTNVIAAVNNGRSMVIYTGHGSYDGWAGPAFVPGNVRNLTVTGVFPFAAGFACLTGDFSQTEVFGETWLVQPGNKGALAYLGSSDLSYWDEDDIMERRMMDRLFADAPVQPSIADMVYYGQAAVQAVYPSSAQYYWETYNLLGDPSAQILLGPKVPDFTLAADPTRVDVCNTGQGSSTLSVGSLNDFVTPVDLTLTGAPAGISHTYTPATVTPPGVSVLTLTGDGTTPNGQYPLLVNGAAGALVHDLPLDLGVYTQSPAAPSLLTPANNASDQPIRPNFTWSAADQAAAYDLQIATDVEFTHLVVDVPNLAAASFTPSVDLNTATHYYWRVRAHNACGIGAYAAPFHFTTLVAPGDCPLMATPTTLYSIDFEGETTGWSHDGADNTWALSTTRYYSPTHAFHAIDPTSASDQRLVSPSVALPAADQGPLTLRFWNYQHMVASANGCYDGGILEVSNNNGASWTQVPNNKLLTDPYDGPIDGSSNPLDGLPAWCGAPQDWLKSVVDVTSYAGQTVKFRWRLGSDDNMGREGWYIDDVVVQSCVAVPQYSVTLNPPTLEAAVYPGKVVSFNLTLTNLGAMNDIYTISMQGNGWDVQVMPPGPINLTAGQSASLTVTVTVPAGAEKDSQNIVAVTATSQNDPGVTPAADSTALTLTVRYYGFYLPVVARAE